MNNHIVPNLDILQEAQRRLLAGASCRSQLIHAIRRNSPALRLGHRQSVDFDFLCQEDFDPDELLRDIDIDAMIQSEGIDLPQVLAAGRLVYGEQFNPELTLKALCYFEDGNVPKLPMASRARLVNAVQ